MKTYQPVSQVVSDRWIDPRSRTREQQGGSKTTFRRSWFAVVGVALLLAAPLDAQEPVAWGPDLEFHTFSIVAVDPATGETGVAVTTRNPCVGNAVPWVRAGVGAVATQGGTRVEYGNELLDLLAAGVSPKDALDRLVEADPGRERRQVGVIGIDGRSAQWTGSGQYGSEEQGDWVAERTGATFARSGQLPGQPRCCRGGRGNIPGEPEFAPTPCGPPHRGLVRGSRTWGRRSPRRDPIGRRGRGRPPAGNGPATGRPDRPHSRLRACRAGWRATSDL